MEDIDISKIEKEIMMEDTIDEEHMSVLTQVAGDIIIEYKNRGSISTDALFDRLEKYQASPSELENVYKMIEESGIPAFDIQADHAGFQIAHILLRLEFFHFRSKAVQGLDHDTVDEQNRADENEER